MRSTSSLSGFLALAIGASFATMQAPAVAAEPASQSFNPHNFRFAPGIYRCELNRNVNVRQVSEDMTSAVLQFDKKEYRMRAVQARSGALRYEDASSGLVWLVIVGKSMLLDTKNGRQLANECRV
jgi:hypothetical protein